MGLNNCFANSFLKVLTKAVFVLIFWCCSSKIVFFKQLCHINTKLRPIWNTFGYLNTPETNATSLAFLVLKALATLNLDAASTVIKMYLYVSPSMTLEVHNAVMRYIMHINLMLLIRFSHLVIRVFNFLRWCYVTCYLPKFLFC